MAFIHRPESPCKPAPIYPVAILPHHDRINVRSDQRFTWDDVLWLRETCGKANLVPVPPDDRVNWRLLHICQPSRVALEWLEARGNVWPTYLEPALNLIFNTGRECWDATRYTSKHIYKPYHQHRWFEPLNTRYTGPRRSPQNLTHYGHRRCKVSKAPHCLHIEWRTKSSALPRIKATTIREVIDFDHRAFWQERLLMYEVDLEMLGAMWRRLAKLKSPRHDIELLDKFTNVQIGYRLLCLCHNVQGLVDRLRSMIRQIHKCRIPVNVEHLWPQNHTPSAIVIANSRTRPDFPCQNKVLAGYHNIHAKSLHTHAASAVVGRLAHASAASRSVTDITYRHAGVSDHNRAAVYHRRAAGWDRRG
jgi:hypothetical protein